MSDYDDDMIDTSAAALDSIDAPRLEAMVLAVITEHGKAGVISDDVRRVMVLQHGTMAYSSVTARYRKLIDKGLIIDTGERRPGLSGRAQRVMVATSVLRGQETALF